MHRTPYSALRRTSSGTARRAAGGLTAFVLAAGLAGCGTSGDDSGEGEGDQAVDLSGAFAEASTATSYRVTSYSAQTLSSPLLGVDTRTEIDEDRPASESEVTPEASHTTVDISAVLGPMAGDAPSISLELWATPDRLVLDTRDYAAVQEINPAVDLGPFEPGVSYVDLAAVKEDSPDLEAAILGQGLPDLQEIAQEIPEILDDVQQEGDIVTGSTTYTALLTALGGDADNTARSVAGGIAQNLGVDVDALTALYLDFYDSAPTEVRLGLDDEGSVSDIRYTVDLSDVFERVYADPELFDEPPTGDRLAELRGLARDTEWTATTLVDYEIDDDLKVEAPPETDDDRTQDWLRFLEQSGF